jgi:hypothetical protein
MEVGDYTYLYHNYVTIHRIPTKLLASMCRLFVPMHATYTDFDEIAAPAINMRHECAPSRSMTNLTRNICALVVPKRFGFDVDKLDFVCTVSLLGSYPRNNPHF